MTETPNCGCGCKTDGRRLLLWLLLLAVAVCVVATTYWTLTEAETPLTGIPTRVWHQRHFKVHKKITAPAPAAPAAPAEAAAPAAPAAQ